MSDFMAGSRTCPRASIFQGLKSFWSYFQSKWSGLIRTILPSFTSTTEVLASPLLGEEMKLSPLRKDFSLPPAPASVFPASLFSTITYSLRRRRRLSATADDVQLLPANQRKGSLVQCLTY